MNWFEDLPECCPQKDAKKPNGESFYRLVKNTPPQSEDFFSQRKMRPSAVFKDITECIAMSLSISATIDELLELKKLPPHKNKQIATFALYEKDGMFLQTFRKNHYSWWRSNDFLIESVNVLDNSK